MTFETEIISDTAPLNDLIGLFQRIKKCSCNARPDTRGVASTLKEIAMTAQMGIEIDEAKIPIKEEVKVRVRFWMIPLYCKRRESNYFCCKRKMKKNFISHEDSPIRKESCVIGKVTKNIREFCNETLMAVRVVEMITVNNYQDLLNL